MSVPVSHLMLINVAENKIIIRYSAQYSVILSDIISGFLVVHQSFCEQDQSMWFNTREG